MATGAPSSRHCLVIGGTGMLRGLCLALAGRGCVVTVIARSHKKLASLAAQADPASTIHPLSADYTDLGQLATAVRMAAAARGPFALAVCWVHAPSADVVRAVADLIADDSRPPIMVHVLGSSSADPTGPSLRVAGLDLRRDIVCRRVCLGFVVERWGSRWLTDAEICDGVLGACESESAENTVGTVTPWEKRP
ncbi:MAG: hypothetical protein KF745_11120 [Phycisphaeraceae bacterium]|nr:hypothetical protein [Phycisphaeraceae bacterium]